MSSEKKQNRYQVNYSDIGNNIRKLREGFGWSKFDLAEQMGLSDERSIYYYENGQKITLECLIKISEIFDTTLDSLLVKN